MTRECPSCATPLEEGVSACPGCGRTLPILSVGELVASRYELSALIGEGGLGVVYRAFDREGGGEVALKVFRTDVLACAEAVRRFRGEMEKVRGVSHPNVGRVLGFGEVGPLAYLATEILAGEDLKKTVLKNPRGLPEADALSAIFQMATGLQALHEAGTTHGDFKTAHAVRNEEGFVKILPFGLVKDPLSASESMDSLEYMSPEQGFGHPLDFRSDEYALALVAFEVLTGDVPLRGVDPSDTLLRRLRDVVSFAREPGSRIPPAYVAALSRALAQAPDDRFAAVAEFAQALRAVAPTAAVPPSSSPPPGPEMSVRAAAPASSPPATGTVSAPAPPAPAAEEPAPAARQGDTRRDERFQVPTDVLLRRLAPDGAVAKEERTIAHDLSRSGMRLLTSWSDLAEGDQVSVQEVGGSFASGAVVRHVKQGTDRITRVGVEFVGNLAPDRLVGTTTSIARPSFVSSSAGRPAAGSPARAPERSASSPGFRPSDSISRPLVPGSIPPPRDAPSPPPPRTTTSTPRPGGPTNVTSSIPRPGGPTNPTSSIPRPGGPALTTSIARPVAAPMRSADDVLEEITNLRVTAKTLVGESKIWEALDRLAQAQALAQGTSEERAIRILTWETQAKVPSLLRTAQQNLEELARNEPNDVAVHSALGRIFWEAGLAARARVAFSRVLALDPVNREATAALARLNDPTRRR